MDLSPRRPAAARGQSLALPPQAPDVASGFGELSHLGRTLAGVARRSALTSLSRLEQGRLVVREPGPAGATTQLSGGGGDAGFAAELVVHTPRFWLALARRGSLGAAEAYIDGWWDSPDLVALVRLLARNRDALEGVEGGLAKLARLGDRLWHRLRHNSRSGSRRNIAAHYDQGDEVFALFLDPSLTYSSALFATGAQSLEEAQRAKIDRLCRQLDLGPEDRLLEIGSGWGALAVHAASRYGCRVTTTTISRRQHAFVRRRIAELGLADRVEVLDRDYRDLEGRFDKIVSVEMIEAVGHERLPTFFAALGRLLAPGGLVALQAITIAERFHAAARDDVDFIQRHVFPGGSIPSLASLAAAMAEASPLTLLRVEDLALDYAETLRHWRERLETRRGEAVELGLSASALRLWRYYFAYCEGGFRERAIGCAQLLLAGPSFRGATHRGEPG